MTRSGIVLVLALAGCAPVDVVLVGLPDAGPLACRTNQDCSAESFCVKQELVCEGLGFCEPRAPSACLTDDRLMPAPACGCDGVTYFNACVSSAEGVSVDHPGPCRAPPRHCSCTAPAVCVGCDGSSEACYRLPAQCGEVHVRSCIDQQCVDLCSAIAAHLRFRVDPGCH